ncbi:MAG TPA: hypothetical protein VGW38_23760 [Chloroflexota bacterium]|nr:hypothetical protein [Chloroflexota bacterium]
MADGSLEYLWIVRWIAECMDALLTAGIGSSFTEMHQPQEGSLCDGPLLGAKMCIGGIGMPCHRHLKPTRFGCDAFVGSPRKHECFVGAQWQIPPLKVLPKEHKRLLQERQHAGLSCSIGSEPFNKCRLDIDAGCFCRAQDRLAESGFVEW